MHEHVQNVQLSKETIERGNIVFVDTSKLAQKGRVQSVISSRDSDWAIRNVSDGRSGNKTEPHIEAGVGIIAENLFKYCYQVNIKSFIESDERYLFLLTVCKNKHYPAKHLKRVISGYIDKRGYGYQTDEKEEKRWFVFGTPFVVGFSNSIPVETLGFNPYIRVQLVDEDRTAKILDNFAHLPNGVGHYINEIQRLDPQGKTCVLTSGQSCIFEETCLRNRSTMGVK